MAKKRSRSGPRPFDARVKGEIEHDINRITITLQSGILEKHNARHPQRISALTELLICLRDLMAKCARYSTRVAFTDDVIIDDEVKDVTDLITFVRNAVGHIDSDNHVFGDKSAVVSFCSMYGQGGSAISFGPVPLACDYADDACFFFWLSENLFQATYNPGIRGSKREATSSILM